MEATYKYLTLYLLAYNICKLNKFHFKFFVEDYYF